MTTTQIYIFSAAYFVLSVSVAVGGGSHLPTRRLLSYSSVCAALPVLRRRGNLAPPKVRVRFGPLVSAAALLLCAWLLSNSNWREVRAAAIAGIIGFLIYGGYKMVKSFQEFD